MTLCEKCTCTMKLYTGFTKQYEYCECCEGKGECPNAGIELKVNEWNLEYYGVSKTGALSQSAIDRIRELNKLIADAQDVMNVPRILVPSGPPTPTPTASARPGALTPRQILGLSRLQQRRGAPGYSAEQHQRDIDLIMAHP